MCWCFVDTCQNIPLSAKSPSKKIKFEMNPVSSEERDGEDLTSSSGLRTYGPWMLATP